MKKDTEKPKSRITSFSRLSGIDMPLIIARIANHRLYCNIKKQKLSKFLANNNFANLAEMICALLHGKLRNADIAVEKLSVLVDTLNEIEGSHTAKVEASHPTS